MQVLNLGFHLESQSELCHFLGSLHIIVPTPFSSRKNDQIRVKCAQCASSAHAVPMLRTSKLIVLDCCS